ncbi:hypothetical protein [Demetria terragena]|uniref:hypothetical protein n=1 Tax=Demetria terragena TaxID=63959 RepID=UPI0003671728|nr:hypothetical protein [Demetria terragena]
MIRRWFLPAVLSAYLLLRFFSFVVISIVADSQDPAGVPRGAGEDGVGYFDMTRIWDGDWYFRIVEEGYPSELPRNAAGDLQQNQWAFYPLYPMLVRAVMAITGLSFPVAAPLLALALGAGAALVMAVLLRDKVGPFVAFCAVAVYAASPPSPTLQLAYTESLAMLLLCAFLLALTREKWWLATALALLTGIARPVALPLGLVALVAVIWRWRSRADRPIDRSTYAGMASSLIACGLSGLMWPTYVGWRTGESSAYTDTMATWRASGEIVPFAPWFDNARYALGDVAGPLVLVLATVLIIAAMAGPWAAALGPELRVWTLGYLLYLAAVLDVWTSLYRYLLFIFPLAVVLIGGGWLASDPRSRMRFVGLRASVLVLLGLAWQVWWVWELLRLAPPSDNPI